MTPEKWNARYNAGAAADAPPGAPTGSPSAPSCWPCSFGSTILMATIAFSFQRYFEYQIEEGRKISQ